MKKYGITSTLASTCLSIALLSSAAVYAADKAESADALKQDVTSAVALQGVNINTASEKELIKLPSIGKNKASAIIAYRQQNGQFISAEDLMKIEGIGEKTYQKLKDKIQLN